MIENRFKLECQIILGRKSVKQPVQRSVPESPVPQAKDNSLLSSSAKAFPSEELSIESDAEASFKKKSPRFFRRRKQNTSPGPQTRLQIDSSVSQDTRRQSAGGQLESEVCPRLRVEPADDTGMAVRDDDKNKSSSSSPPTSPDVVRSPTFFSRFRQGSFSVFPSAFTNLRTRQSDAQPQTRDDEPWSSDSSSSDYPPEEYDIRYRPGSSLK